MWKKEKIGRVCKTNQNLYSTKDKWSKVTYLDTGNITCNHIDLLQQIDLSKDVLPSRAKRKVQLNSVIFSTVRPNQNHYGIIKHLPDNLLVSTGFTVLDAVENKIIPDFLYYAITTKRIIEKLQAIAEQSTSAYPSVKPSDIENIEIPLPDIVSQQRISCILRRLDEKIELNNAINKNLSA